MAIHFHLGVLQSILYDFIIIEVVLLSRRRVSVARPISLLLRDTKCVSGPFELDEAHAGQVVQHVFVYKLVLADALDHEVPLLAEAPDYAEY